MTELWFIYKAVNKAKSQNSYFSRRNYERDTAFVCHLLRPISVGNTVYNKVLFSLAYYNYQLCRDASFFVEWLKQNKFC
jgi:hypothetical protein